MLILKRQGFIAFPVLIFAAAVAVGAIGYFGYFGSVAKKATVSGERADSTGLTQATCTQEAKLCPDGTAVGRTGPNCEFAACPGENGSPSASLGQFETDVSNWQTYSNKKYGFEISYPKEWILEENPDGVAILGLYPPGNFLEGVGIKVYFNRIPALRNARNIDVLKARIDQYYMKGGSLSSLYSSETANIGGFDVVLVKEPVGYIEQGYSMYVPLDGGDILEFSADVSKIYRDIFSTLKKIKETSDFNAATISTDRWPAYINNKYLFGFRYPWDYLLFSDVILSPLESDAGHEEFEPANSRSDRVAVTSDLKSNALNFEAINEDISINTWLEANLAKFIPASEVRSRRSITISGKPAVEIVGAGYGESPYKLVVVKPGNYLIVITQMKPSELLEAVLSTFTFNVQGLQ